MERLVDSLSSAQLITWMETPGDGDHEGFMNLADIDALTWMRTPTRSCADPCPS